MTDKELRNNALHMATLHLQTKFDHLARAVAENEGAYIELVSNYYPPTEEVIEEAAKYMKFIDGEVPQ
jgi:hypothetical protein